MYRYSEVKRMEGVLTKRNEHMSADPYNNSYDTTIIVFLAGIKFIFSALISDGGN